MLRYNRRLKNPARTLRTHSTDSERLLWLRIRRKQLLGIQFYRQKPVGNYIVDFFAPKAKLVVEVDGSQHLEAEHLEADAERDRYLNSLGLTVLRFSSREVMTSMDTVLEAIFQEMAKKLG